MTLENQNSQMQDSFREARALRIKVLQSLNAPKPEIDWLKSLPVPHFTFRVGDST